MLWASQKIWYYAGSARYTNRGDLFYELMGRYEWRAMCPYLPHVSFGVSSTGNRKQASVKTWLIELLFSLVLTYWPYLAGLCLYYQQRGCFEVQSYTLAEHPT
jgi:hypothetical protein